MQSNIEWWPPQKEAIEIGILDGKNIVLCWPTSGGKTFMMIEAMLRLASEGKRSILLLPGKAAVTEKILQKIPEQISRHNQYFDCGAVVGGRVYRANGTTLIDSRRDFLKQCKIIVGTYESIDKLLRQDKEVLSNLSLIAADEIHKIADPVRGATIDKVIAVLRFLNPYAQVVVSSASLTNTSKMAQWINGKAHVYNYRPTPIRIACYCFEHKNFHWFDGKETPPELISLIANNKRDFFNRLGDIVTSLGKQHLIFQGTRGKSVAYAISFMKHCRSQNEISQTDFIQRMLDARVGFDTAGTLKEDREKMSKAFLEHKLDGFHSTSTLAESFDSKVSLVVIADIKFAKHSISSISLEQMVGRIREPFVAYDGENYGVAVILIKKHEEQDVVGGLLNQRQSIVSGLSDKDKFNEQLLSLISCYKLPDMETILKNTFFGVLCPANLNDYINDSLGMLKEQKFLNLDGMLSPLGSATSQFFIPLSTANTLYNSKNKFSNLNEIECLEELARQLAPIPEIQSAFRYKDNENLASFILLFCYTVPPSKLCKIFHISIPDFKILLNSLGRHIAFLSKITQNKNIIRWQKSIKIGVPLEFSDKFPFMFSLRSGSHLKFRDAVRKSIQNGKYEFEYINIKNFIQPTTSKLLFKEWFGTGICETSDEPLSDIILEFIEFLEYKGVTVDQLNETEYEAFTSSGSVFRFGIHEHDNGYGYGYEKTKELIIKVINEEDMEEIESLFDAFSNRT